jgi:hypothetical protein
MDDTWVVVHGLRKNIVVKRWVLRFRSDSQWEGDEFYSAAINAVKAYLGEELPAGLTFMAGPLELQDGFIAEV